ncbi:FAD-dependent oxidoreductase [Methylobacterium sp. P1-11]|uniref:NAD(P)/FAD-dependent oxidoreductase n=1 Tax=Methylobacterium sp. P1-11 TaxID=2024616 RepID=UPI0011EF54ED|nr:FAD-dependent monooxygenase [Methylobacterium sp. P1-11]KAA0116273.1 FAD-dependent oxidoreductase [Methylobacterium sp. P1-11]
MRRAPPLIIGGGPAGAASAIGLARAGLRPLLIERNPEAQDALCGGFLSWTTVRRLIDLGVDPVSLGAHRVEALALFSGRHGAEARLPAPAVALSRRVLDEALRARARAAGAAIETGIGVRALAEGRVRLVDGGEIHPPCTILATGKHDLRGVARPRPDGDAAVGLRWRLGASRALATLLSDRVELHLFRGGYAGLVIQEDGRANLCLAVRQSRLSEVDGGPDRLLQAVAEESPALGLRLAAATLGRAQAVANVPYGWRAGAGPANLYRIGDQAGVIPSLAGEGIAIALCSGLAAADAIARGEPAERFQRSFSRRSSVPIALAGWLWRAAETPTAARQLVRAVASAPALGYLASRLTRI